MKNAAQETSSQKTFDRVLLRTFISALFIVSFSLTLYLIYSFEFYGLDLCSITQKSPCTFIQKLLYMAHKSQTYEFFGIIFILLFLLGGIFLYSPYEMILKKLWVTAPPAYPFYILAALAACTFYVLVGFALLMLFNGSGYAVLLIIYTIFCIQSLLLAPIHCFLLERALKARNITSEQITDELKAYYVRKKIKKEITIKTWHLMIILVGAAFIAAAIVYMMMFLYKCNVSIEYCADGFSLLLFLALAISGMLVTIFICPLLYWLLPKTSDEKPLQYRLLILTIISLLLLSYIGLGIRWEALALLTLTSALHLYLLYYYDKKWGLPKVPVMPKEK
jgi:sulfur transfer complex TusBCD TusB component (DsrH family)